MKISQATVRWGFPHGTSIHGLVFDEEDGVIILEHRSVQQCSRFVEGAGSNDVPSWRANEVLLQRLTVSWPVTPSSAHRGPDHQRYSHLIVVHPAIFPDVIDDLVGSQHQKIAEHDLYNRAETANGHPCGDRGESSLAQRCGQHSFRKLTGQTLCHFEGTAVRVQHIFAQNDDTRILAEHFVQSRVERTENVGCHHACAAAPTPRVDAFGNGCCRAQTTACCTFAAASSSTRSTTWWSRRARSLGSGSFCRWRSISSSGRMSSLLEWWQRR